MNYSDELLEKDLLLISDAVLLYFLMDRILVRFEQR